MSVAIIELISFSKSADIFINGLSGYFSAILIFCISASFCGTYGIVCG
jgi:hypothetical protein